jgi:hypothetical protein
MTVRPYAGADAKSLSAAGIGGSPEIMSSLLSIFASMQKWAWGYGIIGDSELRGLASTHA